MKKYWTFLAITVGIAGMGCSGGQEVTDNPPPVTSSDKNKFETTIDRGAAVSEDGAPRTKSGDEGTG